jgi:hypothetical protein
VMYILRQTRHGGFSKYKVGEIRIVEMEFNGVLCGKVED